MITLSLLHPIKQLPVQVWTFENESVIRIGRSTDNHVILYSAVVSRHHVELRRVGASWELVNLGTNGTYLDGKRITQVCITDGAVIRLARSGPNIQIRLGAEALKNLSHRQETDRTMTQRSDDLPLPTDIMERHKPDAITPISSQEDAIISRFLSGTIPVPEHLRLPDTDLEGDGLLTFAAETTPEPVQPDSFFFNSPDSQADRLPQISAEIVPVIDAQAASEQVPPPLSIQPSGILSGIPSSAVRVCSHARGGDYFCVDCGQPLRVLQTVCDYQLVRLLGQGKIATTYHAWKAGQHVALKLLNPDWVDNAQARGALECEADLLRPLNHPCIPHFIDLLMLEHQAGLVMSLMPGPTLSQTILAAGPVSLQRAIDWILSLCSVLEYLHQFAPPIVHRGIHPQNLLRMSRTDGSEAIALVGFGAIKALVLDQAISPHLNGYVAPEQMDWQATAAADLFALGPLLAYLVTGRPPVSFYADQGDGMRFCAAMVSAFTPDVVEIVHRLTDPKPEQRFPSAAALAEALRFARVETSFPVDAPPHE